MSPSPAVGPVASELLPWRPPGPCSPFLGVPVFPYGCLLLQATVLGRVPLLLFTLGSFSGAESWLVPHP